MPKNILVTGATGFIGGAICIEFSKLKHNVIGVDKVSRARVLPFINKFYKGDFVDVITPDFLRQYNFDVVIHCAGTSLVGPSIAWPDDYYTNNVSKTIQLISLLNKYQKKSHFMFSSSASVYKTSKKLLDEDDAKDPQSPYARTKLMIEQVLEDYRKAHDFKYTVFRYFNACGAIPNGVHGQEPHATHIFPQLFESKAFLLNGSDYNTEDGTCVRDYIHISDIANAHVRAMERHAIGIYNLGSGVGMSNQQIINKVFEKTGEQHVHVGARRPGDSDSLVAEISKAKMVMQWTPVSTLADIVNDLDSWYKSTNYRSIKFY
jgi:UDP-glucose 4-epimerase